MEAKLKEVFKSNIPFQDSHEAECMFFNCCDFRFRPQSQEFLGDKKADLFVFPGSIMLFVGAKHGHADMKDGAVYWTKAIAKLHHVKEIVLVMHKGCGAYASAPALAGKSPEEIYNIQMQDVSEVKDLLAREMSDIKLSLYYMQSASDNSSVTFSEITF